MLAESCTAGLIAASLARIPGISEVLCGSAVTYRDDTKARWLRVGRTALRNAGAVSSQVAQQMAAGALAVTPEADLSAAITGHLGPAAPPGMDGLVYVAVGQRGKSHPVLSVARKQLAAGTRLARQREATLLVVQELLKTVERSLGARVRAPRREF